MSEVTLDDVQRYIDAAMQHQPPSLPANLSPDELWSRKKLIVGGDLDLSPQAMAYIQGKITFPTSTVSRGTSLPSSPTDGQEYVLVDSATAPTYQWRFRYSTANTGSYKWEFVGGAPVGVFQSGAHNVSSSAGAWGDFSTAGPSFTVPRAGNYRVSIFGHAMAKAASAYSYLGLSVEGSDPTNSRYIYHQMQDYNGTGFYDITGMSASGVLKLMGHDTNAGRRTSWQLRGLTVVPVQVS